MIAADILQAFQEAGLHNKDKVAAVGKRYVFFVVDQFCRVVFST
jgi:hypothetical protein